MNSFLLKWSANKGSVQSPEMMPSRSGSALANPGNNWITLRGDVRLDNRASLAGKLETNPGSNSDAQLIILAYQKWGKYCASELLGDFAFVLIDERAAKALLVRDHVGIQSLYYRYRNGTLHVSNDVRRLVSGDTAAPELNPKAIAEYLRDHKWHDMNAAFIAGVGRLPPATSWLLPDETAPQRYWQPKPARFPAGISMEQAAEAFRPILQDAVECRLVDRRPTAVHLSGGLDSSAVAAVAARHSSRVKQAFNWIPPTDDSEHKSHWEWQLAEIMANELGLSLQNVHLAAADYPDIFQSLDLAAHEGVTAIHEFQLRSLLDDDVVVLSGWGGDEFASYNGLHTITDLFWTGEMTKVFRLLAYNAHGERVRARSLASRVWHHAIKPRIATYEPSPVEYARFARGELLAEMQRLAQKPLMKSPWRNADKMHESLFWGALQDRIESWQNTGRRRGIEYRFPLLDKRIIEFVMGLPAELFYAQKVERAFFREVCRGLLPEPVRVHDDKYEVNRVRAYLHAHRQGMQLIADKLDGCGQTGFGSRLNTDLIDVDALKRSIRAGEVQSDGSGNSDALLQAQHRSMMVALAGHSILNGRLSVSPVGAVC